MAKLPDRIKELRKSADMTQEEFGQMLGVVKSTVSLYESGKSTPNDEIKKKICNYFKVSLDYLLGLTNDKYNIPNISDEEWRYPPTENRFGKILTEYRKDNTLTRAEFAEQLDISEDLETKLEIGVNLPSFDLIKKMVSVMKGYTVDYLIGAVDTARVPFGKIEIDGKKITIR